MTPAELRQRLAEVAAWPTDEQPVFGARVSGARVSGARVSGARVSGERAEPGVVDGLTPAAVLVPVVMAEEPGVLLTKRTPHLTEHAGQVSFPGGRIDPEDSGPEAAALREAWEEIGLAPDHVEVLGRLNDHVTGTRYRITPIISVVPPALDYTLSEQEVESVFELPMHVLLDPAAPRRQRQHVRGVWREYWVWPHPEHFIWGATAAILVQLAERLRRRMA